MMKLLLLMLFVVSCGGNTPSKDGASAVVDEISGQTKYDYKAVLEVADSDNPCFGGALYYIQHEGKSYQISDFSNQVFQELLEDIFENKTSYKPFEAGGCHNKYTIHFNGEFTREMKWVGAGEVMTDVIQVQSYLIK